MRGFLKRLALLPISLAFGCLVAGVYGAIHDQISYTVSPSYFHDFKFEQFAIDPVLHDRFGASIVGWSGSWWMGLIIGLPIYCAGLVVRGNKKFSVEYIRAAILVVLIALVIGLGALAISFVSISKDHLPAWMEGWSVDDPVAFARVGTMHNFAYIGGFVGLASGVVMMLWAGWKSRRKQEGPQLA